MSQASEIIKEIGMSDGAIAQVIGFTRVAVLRARLEQSNGERMLPNLRKLYQLQKGKSYGVVPYVPATATYPQEPDVPPLTEEELRQEEEWDKYAAWEELQPVAHKAGQIIKGVRGRIVESILPDGYSLIKTPASTDAQIVESTPPPPKPKGKPYWEGPHPRRARKRKSRYQPSRHIMRPQYNLATLGLTAILSLFMPKQQTTLPSHQLPAPQERDSMPRYVPTNQWVPTQTYVTLSTPRTPRINSLGYASQVEQEPVQPTIYYGKIPTNRYNP